MMTFEQAMLILGALEQEGVRYVLVGSMGLAMHGLVRATRDMDLFVAPDEENVASLRRALYSVFKDSSIEEISADDLGGNYPAIQYVPPEGDFSLDILSRLGEMFRFDELEWEEITIEGIRVRVATPKMLFLMKRNTVRPQDKVDAMALCERFGLEEK
jgi:hypothetical protein